VIASRKASVEDEREPWWGDFKTSVASTLSPVPGAA